MTSRQIGTGLVDLVTREDRRMGYERLGWWDEATLAGRIAEHARLTPDAVAVIDGSGRYSYQQLVADAASLTDAFVERGVGPGAVVSVQLPNCYQFAVIALAVQSLEAVINPVLPSYRVRELAHSVSVARPAIVISPTIYRGFDHREMIREVAAHSEFTFSHVVVSAASDAANAGSECEENVVSTDLQSLIDGGRPSTLAPGRADVVSELIFTSGTEAQPKAIMHTEQTANFSVRIAYADLHLGPEDVVWMPSPLGHSTGFNYGLRFALFHRLPLVLQDRWDPRAALDLIRAENCSYTMAASTFLQDLVEEAMAAGVRLDSLRYFGCGGAPVAPALVDAAEGCGIRVLRLYGSTEVLVGTWNGPTSSADQRRSTDGLPLSHVEIEVRDSGSPVLAGHAGELYVRGPNTCVGFFADLARTDATFSSDGWVRTGDLVVVDTDGFLTVVGRKKEIIIRGGLNIAPREIEELLVGFDEVERAAVVGIPDERLGERMCACVVLQCGEELDFATMVERLRATGLATYKLPERLEVLSSLPTTPSGKVQKHQLVLQICGDGTLT
jgi:acyl-CoA synthetase (AMP-forming)/AMP-acid ligase II